jgi:beta-galactosidase
VFVWSKAGTTHSAFLFLPRRSARLRRLLKKIMAPPDQQDPSTQRDVRFPDGFIWGASTAAYQIEGAVHEGGRGLSNWDAFSHTPGRTKNGDTGDVAIDHYHRYKEDVQLMKQIGLQAYRFSIAWSRILPAGTGAVNEEGVQFYNDLINELIANGITPAVTLHHGDLPLALQTEFDGWLGSHIHKQFADYARVCFSRFGDRVKTWFTINEPMICSIMGYGLGVAAPGRKINPHTEPYIAGHNMLLAHAHAVEVYREEFQTSQGGQIGLTFSAMGFYEPGPTEDPEEQKANAEAAKRAMAFDIGWFADPIYIDGNYPAAMKERLGDRLPSLSDEEQALVKGSCDFFSLNHYGSCYVKPSEVFASGKEALASERRGGFFADTGVTQFHDPSWVQTGAVWNYVTPWGMKKLLMHIQQRYAPAGGVLITENGSAWPDTTKEEALKDENRTSFFREYLSAVRSAMDEGVDVRAYYAWSLFDNYEWSSGFGVRFGLVWVDYETLERTPKGSAHWYRDTIALNGFTTA